MDSKTQLAGLAAHTQHAGSQQKGCGGSEPTPGSSRIREHLTPPQGPPSSAMEPCNCSALQHGAASVRNCMLADSDWAVTRFGDKATNMTGATVGAALACAAALLCLFWCAYASYRERRAQKHSPQAWVHAIQTAQAAQPEAELTPPIATEEQQQAYYGQQSHMNAAIFLERADAQRSN